jgi:hypothetical protein
MSHIHVLHSSGGVDAEEADEVNGIGGVLRLMQDAVAPQLLGGQADLVEGGSQPAVAQGRAGRVMGGLAGDEQVRVCGVGPTPAAFGQPGVDQVDGEFVEVDDRSSQPAGPRRVPAGRTDAAGVA